VEPPTLTANQRRTPPNDHDVGIFVRFAEIVDRCGDSPAVSAEGSEVSYAELDARAAAISRALPDPLDDPAPLALLLDPGIDSIVAIVAVLRSGRPYVALNTSDPPERLRTILADCGSPVLLVNAATAETAAGLGPDAPRLIDVASPPPGDADCPAVRAVPGALAYVLYTSGSTGTPKGVMQTQRNVVYAAEHAAAGFGLTSADRHALLSPVAFGQAASVIMNALLSGGCVVVHDARRKGLNGIGEWLRRERVTIVQTVPTVLRHVVSSLRPEQRLESLRAIRLGGEPLSGADVESFARHLDARCRIVNSYGSTEVKSIARFDADPLCVERDELVPVGFAVGDRRLRVCDEAGNEVPAGSVGEVRVRSTFMSPGYWSDSDLTRRRFQRAADGAMEFCTGDLGRVRSDGALVLVGRGDAQVKLRGHRIELGEIEAALLASSGVVQAAACVRDGPTGHRELAAFLVMQPGATIDRAALRGALSAHLPRYMLPSRFIGLPRMPLRANGKVDRQALAREGIPEQQDIGSAADPENGLQRLVAEVWAHELGQVRVGVDESFFDLGGDSVQASRMLTELGELLDVEVPLSVLAQAHTIKGIAAWIDRNRAQSVGVSTDTGRGSLVALRSRGNGAPIFFLPGGGGDEHITYFLYGQLARHMCPDRPVYAFVGRGYDGLSDPHTSVPDMARDYLEEARRVQPRGPYYLVGHCAGGVAAYEMALQLHKEGERVERLVLIDSRARGTLNNQLAGQRQFLRSAHRFTRQLSQRLAHHTHALRGMGVADGVRYLFDKSRKAVAFYYHATVPYTRFYRDHRAAARVQGIRRRQIRNVRRYDPAPYSGAVTVLANAEWHDADPTLGWRSKVSGPLDTRRLPGNHRTHLRDNVGAVAAMLDDCLGEPGGGQTPANVNSDVKIR